MTHTLGHTHPGPLMLLVPRHGLAAPLLQATGLTWVAHTRVDRVLDDGLKYALGFKVTHLRGGSADDGDAPSPL